MSRIYFDGIDTILHCENESGVDFSKKNRKGGKFAFKSVNLPFQVAHGSNDWACHVRLFSNIHLSFRCYLFSPSVLSKENMLEQSRDRSDNFERAVCRI